MRDHAVADDRQRVIHALVRETVEGAVPEPVHLTTEDLAALVSGTLFKTECSRIENHLLSCEECAELAHRIDEDFEAGVVPILLRRAPAAGAGVSLSARITRRWSPWLLGILASLIVLSVSATSVVECGGATQRAEQDMLVYLRLGSPYYLSGRPDEGPVSVEPGFWLDGGDLLDMGSGDLFEAMDRDGRYWRITSQGQLPVGDGDSLSRALALQAWQDREALEIQGETEVPGAGPQRGPLHLVHPRGLIYRTRPRIRWATNRVTRSFFITILDAETDEKLFSREAEGRSLPWPDDVLPLEPGRVYTAQIRRKTEDAPVEKAVQFRVLEGEARTAVTERLAALATQIGRGPNLLRCELLRQFGLHAECREELERLRVSETENVSLLLRLKHSLEELGLLEEAARTLRLIKKRR